MKIKWHNENKLHMQVKENNGVTYLTYPSFEQFPDKGAAASYVNRILAQYTAKWGIQIAGIFFQTGSGSLTEIKGIFYPADLIAVDSHHIKPASHIHASVMVLQIFHCHLGNRPDRNDC